ncbi:bifunctional DedA family/phosphatase PAP2 family protein [Bacillus nakamurai]|uniref:Alkaline phosphatase n=2 Tax=Bacillus nakamurai TaxID=1793963 RepID=A0A150F9V4_9BACI|nr:bifunctional DedA family/phosphatase PAP2 family protein [Bacillus nakamurai]KXZ20522.1 alkaline phosphatase [Bacillus nakamurai]MED1229834.1 bifunctional DedA family/phosphatase PAP2 family protein [Bacillus nakamurai]
MQFLINLMEQHGYVVLFFSLMLELIALPLPGEFIMGYAGHLIFQGRLDWIISIIAAGVGGSVGMTISYWIGYKLGPAFFHKYGHRIHMGPDRLDKISFWFEKFGNKLLLISCFIPGVRHITGYFSGVTQISFRLYAVYAFIGAFLWTGIFISLGNILGPQWHQFDNTIKRYFLIGSIIVAIIFAIFYVYRNYKKQIKEFILAFLGRGVQRFRSLRRLRILIVGIVVLFLGFVVIMGGLTQDYLNNEFKPFDTLVLTLIPLLFNEQWAPWMNTFSLLASPRVLLPLIILTFLWIMFRGKDRVIEVSFLLIVSVGGEAFEEGIRRIFYRLHPVHAELTKNILYPFPSEQTLTAFILYGFSAFLLVRHLKMAWLQTFTFIIVSLILVLVGLSRIYFKIQYPSDVVSGYIFGGVWLSLNILVMELFRFSKLLKKKTRLINF